MSAQSQRVVPSLPIALDFNEKSRAVARAAFRIVRLLAQARSVRRLKWSAGPFH